MTNKYGQSYLPEYKTCKKCGYYNDPSGSKFYCINCGEEFD